MNLLWAGMIVGEWYIAALAFRKLRITYPWFTSLVCYMAIKSLVLFYIRALHPESYFYPYYSLEIGYNVLQLGATVEIFGTMFRPFWTVPRNSLITLTLFTFTGIVILAKATSLSVGTHGEWGFYQSLDKALSCSIALVLGAVLMFTNHFQMPYRSRLRGIATGIFIMSVSSVLSAFASSQFLNLTHISFAYIPVTAHYVTLTVWCYHVGRKEALVAVIGRNELEEVQNLLNQFTLALRNTPTYCGLTLRKPMGKAICEQKAKMVNHNG